MIVRRRRKPEENAAQGKNGHFWMETTSFLGGHLQVVLGYRFKKALLNKFDLCSWAGLLLTGYLFRLLLMNYILV